MSRREIKFRVWDRKAKKMVMLNSIEYRDAIEGRNGVTVFCESDKKYYWLENGEFDLLQYTGLKDDSGQEIYECDIVEYWGGSGIIVFYMGSFTIEYTEDDHFAINGNIKIIGNIYENPELI